MSLHKNNIWVLNILIFMLSSVTYSNAADITKFEPGRLSIDIMGDYLIIGKVPFSFTDADHFDGRQMLGYYGTVKLQFWPIYFGVGIGDYWQISGHVKEFNLNNEVTTTADIDMTCDNLEAGVYFKDCPQFRLIGMIGHGRTGWWTEIIRNDSITQSITTNVKEQKRIAGYYFKSKIDLIPKGNMYTGLEVKRTFDDNKATSLKLSIGYKIKKRNCEKAFCYPYIAITQQWGRYNSFSTIGLGLFADTYFDNKK